MDRASPFQPWATEESAVNVRPVRELVDDAKLHRENVNHPKHRQTASYDKDCAAVTSNAPGSPSSAGPGANLVRGKESKMDSGKITSMQQIVENTLSQESRQRITQVLDAVEALSSAERLLLYLRLPTGVPPHDPLKQPVNPLGSRAELQQTVTWIQTHLEVDPDVSLPKQDVYDEYIAHCMSSNMKPLSTADFGKVMKQVYPTVRPRRLGTRGNSRYCYAGLRKKIKLEVPQLPDLGESSKEPLPPIRESERIVCEWAETKLGVKVSSIAEVARHVGGARAASPSPTAGLPEDASSRQLMKQLKRKIQTQGTPGRPKKNKGQDIASESPPSTSYTSLPPLKQESEAAAELSYGYQPAYAAVFEGRAPYAQYGPPRAHPPPAPAADYRAPYLYEPPYAPRDLSVPSQPLPINLSSDATRNLTAERAEWQRRRPPEPPPPPPPRLSLPGKKLILETYQSETRASSPRSTPIDSRSIHHPTEELPRTEYLPKKMRAAEILGGKLAASRQALASTEATSTSVPVSVEPAIRPEVAFLEDSKNLTSRSKSTAAALAREEQEAASPTLSVKTPTSKVEQTTKRKPKEVSPERPVSTERTASPDSCCGLDGINIKTGMICEAKHSEILNRERVISICNIDKHDLDDYLNEGNSQEHEEELLQYFHARPTATDAAVEGDTSETTVAFLEASQDPHEEHSQGKNEKISQLRELLAKNLKNQSGSNSQHIKLNQEPQLPDEKAHKLVKTNISEGAFKALVGASETEISETVLSNQTEVNCNKYCNTVVNENGTNIQYTKDNIPNPLITNVSNIHLFNGHCHNEPQSPTTRTQQYDFVPISDGCHSPGHFHSKSPLGFGQREQSPSKINKPIIMGGSLQTSPISHSTAASPFVSPRNTPVPRSKLCPRPIPKVNGRKRRNMLTLGVNDSSSKQFAIPNDQKFNSKLPFCGPGKYCQPMSAPPSPNILSSQYKNQFYQCSPTVQNGNNSLLPSVNFRDQSNGDQPLSADPLSSEVSQFFQDPLGSYRPGHDVFRSQSVPLKQGGINNFGLLSYNNTPAGSVPPTPIPNEFCDFGSLADACDISKAGLNRETLDKIYNAIDSSHDVLNTETAQNLLTSNDNLTNGCEALSEQSILSEEPLIIPSEGELLTRNNQYNQTFVNDSTTSDVEEFLKRTSSIEFDLSELTEKNKYYTSRSVPSTPLPFKRTAPILQINSRRSRDLHISDYANSSNGISSKSVPSTPQFTEDRSVFSYSNRDFLINGNSVCGSTQLHDNVVNNEQGIASPLHDILREGILDPLTPALLADLDKIDGPPYVDL